MIVALRARRGFTLWEMAMVMVILAVLTAIAVPAIVSFGADRPRSSTDQLLDLVNDSRRVAIRHKVMTTLLLDPESGHYRVDTVGSNGLGAVVEDTLDIGASEVLETDLPRLRFMFRPTGAAFGDTVVIKGTDATRVLMVDRWSGVAYARAR